jgi:hypothetical protein
LFRELSQGKRHPLNPLLSLILLATPAVDNFESEDIDAQSTACQAIVRSGDRSAAK